MQDHGGYFAVAICTGSGGVQDRQLIKSMQRKLDRLDELLFLFVSTLKRPADLKEARFYPLKLP